MSYTVLARKYRSQTFDGVVGQEPISKTLKNAIKAGKVAHAYLFTGTRGVGKTTMARVLAKSLNCLGFDSPTAEPCCRCEGCRAVNAGDDIDVIEIDGATHTGVEQVRQLRENTVYSPTRSRFKIYIIDEVHMLSTGAFNALLKTLEEPPGHVKFIFATTEPNKVPLTVQSRCQRFDFRNISSDLIDAHLKEILKKEGVKYEDRLTASVAAMANGSMRDALSLLDRLISTGEKTLTCRMLEEFLGCPNAEMVCDLADRVARGDAGGVLALSDQLAAAGLPEVQVASALVECMRELLLAKYNAKAGGAGPSARAAELAEKFDAAAIVYNITALEKLQWSLKNSDTPRALLDAALVRLALSEHFMNVDELLGRMGRAQDAPVKKKSIAPGDFREGLFAPDGGCRPQHDESPVTDLWRNFLAAAAPSLGAATAGLLSCAEPESFEKDVLTLRFDSSNGLYRKISQDPQRMKAITSALSGYFGRTVSVRLEEASAEPPSAGSSVSPVDDPAVRNILSGLDATVTGVD
jgi:DNA polymerase-3 subunit gamma/tau